MSLFGRLGQLFGPAMKRTFSLLDFSGYTAGSPAWPSRNYQIFAQEGYIENATVYACLELIAASCAGIDWKNSKKQKNGKLVPYTSHALLDLLANPNKEQSGSDLVHQEVCYHYLNGQVFTVLIGSPVDTTQPMRKPPVALLVPRPDFVAIIPDEIGMAKAYRIGMSAESTKRDYDASRVQNWKRFHPLDPLKGLAPLEPAAKHVDTENALLSYLYKMLRRNGRPDGVIISEQALGDEQWSRLKSQVEDKLNNSSSPGGFKVLEGNVKIQEFAFKPSDMGLSKQEIDRISGICRAFKVPPELIGVAEVKTFSNYKEARRAFYLETILPLMDSLRDRRNASLTYLYGDQSQLDYDKDNIEALQEDRNELWRRLGEAETAGRITANEFREGVGLPPAEDELASQRLLPISRIPADEFSMASEGTGQGGNPQDASDEPDEDEEDAQAPANRTKRSDDMTPLVMVRGKESASTWRAFDSARVGYMKQLRRIFGNQIKQDYEAAADAMMTNHPGNFDKASQYVAEAIKSRSGEWRRAYNQAYNMVGMSFAQKVDAGLASAFGRSAKFNKRSASDSWALRIENYLATVAGQKIQDISNTTLKRIQNAMASGYEEGLGADAIAEIIRDAAPRAADGPRALLIARTEVISASNLGSDAAARAFGVPLEKEWLSTADGRTREDHDIANGQAKALDDLFEVGGQLLSFPGDSSYGAGPEEVCNCRCTQTYKAAEGGADF